MTALAESLLKCKVTGKIVSLPPISDGPLLNYQEVRTALRKAGAKYKRNTFVFNSDAKPFIDRLTNGESVNIQKEFQFFATPKELADRMVKLAGIKEGNNVLEPSAGQGAIIEAIYKAFPYYMKGPNDKPGVTVDYCELMEINKNIISQKINSSVRWSCSTSFMGEDFLQFRTDRPYDVVIANPPFTKNQDIDHIYKMYEVCKLGGIIVTLASPSWTFGSQKKQLAFREWLEEINAEWEELPTGTFKDSGTTVRTILIKIEKLN